MFSPQRLKELLRRGTRVVIGAQVASQLVSLGVLAVLYRALGPEPYGLLGMVVPLLLFVRIFITAGLDVAAVQQAELDDRQVSALFWLNQGLGLAMTAVTAAAAPLVACFYGSHDLIRLTLALAGTSLATALGTQHQALLQRKLRLGALAVIRLAALVLGSVAAIAAALAGWGVWALVVQQYVELLALAALAWIVEPWRPKPAIRLAPVTRLLHFGGYYTLSSLMFYLMYNADKVLVGAVLGPRALGLYSQAFGLMMKPVHVVITPLTGVMLPGLARAAGNPRQYTELALGFFRFIGLVMLPAGVGLVVVAPEAMRVLGGAQWTEAGPILAALAIAILVQGFFNALGSLLASAGRADRLFRGSALVACVILAAYVVGLQVGIRLGRPLLGVALGYSLTMLLVVFPAYLLFCLRTVGIAPGRWLAQLRTSAPASLAMGLIVAGARYLLTGRLPDGPLLALEVLVGVLVYCLLARREIVRLLKKLRRAPFGVRRLVAAFFFIHVYLHPASFTFRKCEGGE